METLFGAVLVLAFPIISIAALIMTLNARVRVRVLELRIADLEVRRPAPPIAAAPAAAALAAAPVDEPPPPVVEAPIAQAAAPEPPREAPVPPTHVAAAASTTLEERFGTQWVVWIGGLALALGGIFLVRYSIEQGLIGPGVRVILGALFAAVLIAAGEWTRRNEIAAGIVAVPTQHIPSILTAAGTIAAYATVYAAYALYGFLSQPVGFHPAGSRGLGDTGGGAAARTGARRSWHSRRIRHPPARPVGSAELFGALRLSRDRHRRRLCLGAHAAVALARDHGRGARCTLDAARRCLSACRLR